MQTASERGIRRPILRQLWNEIDMHMQFCTTSIKPLLVPLPGKAYLEVDVDCYSKIRRLALAAA